MLDQLAPRRAAPSLPSGGEPLMSGGHGGSISTCSCVHSSPRTQLLPGPACAAHGRPASVSPVNRPARSSHVIPRGQAHLSCSPGWRARHQHRRCPGSCWMNVSEGVSA